MLSTVLRYDRNKITIMILLAIRQKLNAVLSDFSFDKKADSNGKRAKSVFNPELSVSIIRTTL